MERLLNWFRGLFGVSQAEQSPDRQLRASNRGELGRQLDSLGPGERGWLTSAECAQVFEIDSFEFAGEGGREVGAFAEGHGCVPNREPAEGRIYFMKKPT